MHINDRDREAISEIFGDENPVYISDLVNNIKVCHEQIGKLKAKIKEYETFIYVASMNLDNDTLTRGGAEILVERYNIK